MYRVVSLRRMKCRFRDSFLRMRRFARSCSLLQQCKCADDCLNQVLRALKKSGEWDNTMIIFLSDHGMPLPFAKTQLYHHSTRTPLMVRVPGVTKAGTVDKRHMVSVLDLLPTIMDALGVEKTGSFGRSLNYPVLAGNKQADREIYHQAIPRKFRSF